MARIRKTEPRDFPQLYLMGYDAWSDGMGREDYVAACSQSPKYAKGQWFILDDGTGAVSTLITYEFSPGVFGIGSVATPPEQRRRGFASKLVEGVVDELVQSGGAESIFLYSDIPPEFYRRYGFVELPAELQKKKDSACMVRPEERLAEIQSGALEVPGYF